MARQLRHKRALLFALFASLALVMSCSVGNDLSKKQFACTTTADCVGGTYCDPTLGACVLPDATQAFDSVGLDGSDTSSDAIVDLVGSPDGETLD